MKKKRILAVYQGYGQVTKTYIENEVSHLASEHDLLILNVYRPANRKGSQVRDYLDCIEMAPEEICQIARDFRPDHIHGQYLHLAPLLERIAAELSVPFTLRSHSYDILEPEKMGLDRFPIEPSVAAVCSPRCAGLLAMPFALPRLESWGVELARIRAVPPIFDFDRFHDRAPNGVGIMNVGAALPKKNMYSYLELGHMVPELDFDLYGIGFDADKLERQNQQLGGRVHISGVVPYEQMPQIYKEHNWLVYTADPKVNSVGWPIAVLEAQASGVGVCMPRLRPDLEAFLGDSAVLYDSIEELPEIIGRSPDQQMRERGFENARRFDYRLHQAALNDLFDWNHA